MALFKDIKNQRILAKMNKEIEKHDIKQKQIIEFDKLTKSCLNAKINTYPFKSENVIGISGECTKAFEFLIKCHVASVKYYSIKVTTLTVKLADYMDYCVTLAALNLIYPLLSYDKFLYLDLVYPFDDKSLGELKLNEYLTPNKNKDTFNNGNPQLKQHIKELVNFWFNNKEKLKDTFGGEKVFNICEELQPLKDAINEYEELIRQKEIELAKAEEEKRAYEMHLKQENLIEEEKKKQNESIKRAGLKGEQEVSYALKFLDNCIILDRNSNNDTPVKILNIDYIDEVQEFDHIVIGDWGILLIETKAYSGTIEIDEVGNWTRLKSDSAKEGMLNPIQQVRRHEKVMNSIFTNSIPVYSIICLANSKVVLSGANHSAIPVIKSDMLVEYIESTFKDHILTNKQKEDVFSKIQKYTVL